MHRRHRLLWVVVLFSVVGLGPSASAQEYPAQIEQITIQDPVSDAPTDELVTGEPFTFFGTGYEPGAIVDLLLDPSERSTRRRAGRQAPISLGTAVADATGTVRATVLIPPNLDVGTYRVQMTGPAAGGGIRVLTSEVEVVSTPSVAAGQSTLPVTGSDRMFPTVVAATVLVLIGIGLLLLEQARLRRLA